MKTLIQIIILVLPFIAFSLYFDALNKENAAAVMLSGELSSAPTSDHDLFTLFILKKWAICFILSGLIFWKWIKSSPLWVLTTFVFSFVLFFSALYFLF